MTPEQRQAMVDQFLREALGDPGGRAWIWDLLSSTNNYASIFAADALVMAQNSGRRDVGLQVLADIMRVDPQSYINMLKENEHAVETTSTDDSTEGS